MEGHELAVLNGAKHTIGQFKPILMIELYKEHNPKVLDCFKIIFDFGYTCFYCTNSGIKEFSTIESAASIIENPTLSDRVITNFFFIPLVKKEMILRLFQKKQ